MRGMVPNERFAEVVQRHFAKDARLVLGCAAGMRSERACQSLSALGYQHLVNMDGGFSGARDASGAVVQPGWEACQLPVEREAGEGRTYAELSAAAS